MNTILKLNEVSLNYHSKEGETLALEHINIEINEGEFVSIIGPSGCGKTTILSLVSGIIPASSGEIILDGKEIKGPSLDIGYMLQRDQLFEWRTIFKNIVIGLEIQKKLTPDNIERINGLIEKYGLKDFKNHYPSQLSGGMRQRAALIRTLATSPKILLLDESFSALDYQTRLAVCDDVHQIIKNEGKTALLVTHDISEAISLSDKVIVLSARPARVKNIYTIDISGTPFARRENPGFQKYFDNLWKELQVANENE